MNPFIQAIEKRLTNSWDKPVFTNYNSEISYTGKKIFDRIKILHTIFKDEDIKQDDKIVLIGRNSCEWCISFLAIITYNAVVVPILPDFHRDDIQHISSHSNAKLFLSTPDFLDIFTTKKTCINIKDFTHRENEKSSFNSKVKTKEFYVDENKKNIFINYAHPPENTLAVISYTSGTSGFVKGVMLSYKNLFSNVKFGLDIFQSIQNKDKMLSFLPLAHIYGCTFEFLYPFCAGISIYFIEKIPIPSVLLEAFRKVKPRLIFMVPLLLEKIYKKKIYPLISSKKAKLLLKLPIIKNKIYKTINASLMKSFGGNFYEVIIGGSALNPEVELFLSKIKFPITVGYGMTECAPLISYSDYKDFKQFSCGQVVHRMTAMIDSEDPMKIPGEILVKGDNVMLGYYKDNHQTTMVLDNKGWLKTGDIGVIDTDNHLFIKGRNKNMLLGSSGQNIYPEEIEAKINHLPMVQESLVIESKNHQLIALIYPDKLYCEKNMPEINLQGYFNKIKNTFNQQLARYMQISKFILVENEFEKTPKKSIKRYLYSDIKKLKKEGII